MSTNKSKNTSNKSKRKSSVPTKRTNETVAYINNYGERHRVQTCKKSTFKNMKFLQNSYHLLIPKLPFSRLVREVMQQEVNDFRVASTALEALQTAAEFYLITLFDYSQRCANHAKRVTVRPDDMNLVLTIRETDPGKP